MVIVVMSLLSKEGDMDIDWGGQGPASMPSGSSCGQLGTDKCAMITGSGIIQVEWVLVEWVQHFTKPLAYQT